MSGTLEVICGPMFAGKSEELIRRLRRAEIANKKVIVFKPAIDKRYDKNDVVSHNGLRAKAIAVSGGYDLKNRIMYGIYDVVAIDEIQFFGIEILEIVQSLIIIGYRVIVSGLDQTYKGEPFGFVPQLLALADSITKLTAICTVCGAEATKTKLLDASSESIINVGASEKYEARCRKHHNYD